MSLKTLFDTKFIEVLSSYKPNWSLALKNTENATPQYRDENSADKILNEYQVYTEEFDEVITAINICEDEENYTKWYVLHAEANAIMKVASSTQSCSGATLYVTLSPCKDCSKLIYQAGIVRVVYIDQYKDTTGIDFLKDAGVEVVQIANPY